MVTIILVEIDTSFMNPSRTVPEIQHSQIFNMANGGHLGFQGQCYLKIAKITLANELSSSF